ncbi:MAG: extracellular solute-binding protein [Vallitalea sp.]|jgi:putative aldouronate transport system substrate-binding protein|nr:extracellular solute-binding protein [Vallitalea sp.]
MKKSISLVLVLLLALSVFTGCGDKKNTNDSGEKETNQAQETSNVTDQQEENKFLCSEKPITLSIFQFLHNPYKDDYAAFKKAAEMTNVSLKGVVSQSSSKNKEAFNLMVVSGEMADIVTWDRAKIQELALDGAFAELDDLIEEHAPNIKAFFEEHPEIKKHATASDGKIYHIPYVPDGDAAEAWFIRQDWLDKLGLEQPKTIDELHDVLLAFKNQDPNGNNKKDEIPYFIRNDKRGNLADLALLWGAHSQNTNIWYVEDGVVKYGPYEKEFKDAYANLAKWYEEGLIDKEIYTRGKTARDYALKENLGGMTHDWFGSTSSYNDKITNIEGFNFIPFAPPANIKGEVKERSIRNKLHWSGWAISSSNKYPVETIKYFDFFFTEEGRRLINYGIEGDTYTMQDGKPILTDKVLKAEEGAVQALRNYGCQLATGFHQDFNYEKQWMNPVAYKGVELYTKNNYFMEQFPGGLPYTPDEKRRFAELSVAIETLMDETVQKWVLGGEDVESGYESYIKALESFGVKELIEIQQTAYDRYIGK